MDSSPQALEIKPAPLEQGHQLVTLPGFVFTPPPPEGQKKAVTIINQRNPKIMLNAQLHGLNEDPMSESGQRAKLEVSSQNLKKIRKEIGGWDVYPGIKNTEDKKTQRGFYEIIL